MENWQKEYIKDNKIDLITSTLCSARLLARLESAGVIGERDRANIVAAGTDPEQATHLYEILAKSNSYDGILRALTLEDQKGAADILQRGIDERQQKASSSSEWQKDIEEGNTSFSNASGENEDKELLIPPVNFIEPQKYRKVAILMATVLIIAIVIISGAVTVTFVLESSSSIPPSPAPANATATTPIVTSTRSTTAPATTKTTPTTTTTEKASTKLEPPTTQAGSTTTALAPSTTTKIETTTKAIFPPCDPTPRHSGWISCPSGDRWYCWASVQTRDHICAEEGFGNYKVTQNKWGMPCFCCGPCPTPL